MLDMVMDTLLMDIPLLDTMAKDQLMLSLKLRPMLVFTMEDMVFDAGLGYAGLGYGGYGYGYPAYGYSTLGYYGKRSADAEPEAEADAGVYYGGYGYGLGYAGLGYAGLGYAGYGYGYPAYGYSTLGYYGKRSADAEPEA